MKLTFKSLFAGVVALAVLSAPFVSFGQDAAEKFSSLAPKMTAENMADEGQVREMENAQQDWMRYCLQDAAKTPEARAEANKIMTDALAADYPVVTKAWLLHILQWTGDAA
ncbi:MAG: hypothetical protein HUK22_04710, partial [Thermoguttaceae bacterium]|nr:hypothetical protein [Thermoguttaceae bacterium]